MFERFTERARRVMVLAQEEARLLNHNFIGTEHVLLGLVREDGGVAAQVLKDLDVNLDMVRKYVEDRYAEPDPARNPTKAYGSPPFTPRAKKVFELSLREALQLGHNYIGTEHILLGLVGEGEGIGAQALEKQGLDLSQVRQRVIQVLAGYGAAKAPPQESNVVDPAVSLLRKLLTVTKNVPIEVIATLTFAEKEVLYEVVDMLKQRGFSVPPNLEKQA